MYTLANVRRELFAQAIFKGATASAAFVTAGFKANRGNAARLNANESIRARVAELQTAAAKKLIEHISFDAIELFKRMEQSIAAAEAAGDHKAAITGRVAVLTAFGYMDSPTLTNEHVRGKPLEPGEAEKVGEERTERNVVHLADSIRAIRKLRQMSD